MKKLCFMVVLSALILSGCAQRGVDLSGGDLGSLVEFNRDTYLAQTANLELDLDFDSDAAEVLLNSPAELIRVTYPLPFTPSKVYIREVSHPDFSGWNINRVLVHGEDYFWDRDAGELFLNVSAPILYLASGTFASQFEFHFLAETGAAMSQTKSIAFHWRPLNEQATEEASDLVKQLVYFESLAEGAAEISRSENQHLSYANIRSSFNSNLSQSQPQRLSGDACRDVSRVASAFGSGRIECENN